jgi:hypothetical protein
LDDIKHQLFFADNAWFTHVYVPLVSSVQPDAEGHAGQMPEGLLEISQDFDKLMDWLSAFHILKPITESGQVELVKRRLKQARAVVNDDIFCTESVHACNCSDAVHYSWCSHAMAYCLLKKIIKGYPRHIDPTPTASRNKRGRMAAAKPGGALHKGAGGLGAKKRKRSSKARGEGRGRIAGRGRGRGGGVQSRDDDGSEPEPADDEPEPEM